MSQLHVFKTSFFLALILPIGNVWAPRGFKRPGSPLHNQRHTKCRRQSSPTRSPRNVHRWPDHRNRSNDAPHHWRPRDDRRQEGRYQRQDHRPWLDWRDEDRPAQRFAQPPRGRSRQDERGRVRDDRRDHRPLDRRPPIDRGRSYPSQRDEQKHYNAYPKQAPRWEDRPPTHRQQEHYQGHHQGHYQGYGQGRRHERSYPPQRDDREHRTHRPPQASSRDAGYGERYHARHRDNRRSTGKPIYIKGVLQQMQRDTANLEQYLDTLCKASRQHRFGMMAMSHTFSALGKLAHNNQQDCDRICGVVKRHPRFLPQMMQTAHEHMKEGVCDPRGFANLLHAFMRLAITPDDAWMETFWHESGRQLQYFNEQNFSNTLYAAAKLGLQPTKE